MDAAAAIVLTNEIADVLPATLACARRGRRGRAPSEHASERDALTPPVAEADERIAAREEQQRISGRFGKLDLCESCKTHMKFDLLAKRGRQGNPLQA